MYAFPAEQQPHILNSRPPQNVTQHINFNPGNPVIMHQTSSEIQQAAAATPPRNSSTQATTVTPSHPKIAPMTTYTVTLPDHQSPTTPQTPHDEASKKETAPWHTFVNPYKQATSDSKPAALKKAPSKKKGQIKSVWVQKQKGSVLDPDFFTKIRWRTANSSHNQNHSPQQKHSDVKSVNRQNLKQAIRESLVTAGLTSRDSPINITKSNPDDAEDTYDEDDSFIAKDARDDDKLNPLQDTEDDDNDSSNEDGDNDDHMKTKRKIMTLFEELSSDTD